MAAARIDPLYSMPMSASARAAFVTGGSGFVGRHLISFLRERGWTVRALARSDAAAAAVEKAGAAAVRGDLDDAEAMRRGMEGCEVVFHAAAKVEVWGKRADFQRINIDGTQRLCDAARAAGVKKVVHVSTEAVLVDGTPIRDADETRPLPARPLGLYPWSKGAAEEVVRRANRDGLTAVIVRPRFIWGKGDTTLLPRLVDLVKRGKYAWIAGGAFDTSTCHVLNLCEALLLAAEKGKGGETYFVTDGDPIEFRRFLTDMMQTAGVDPSRARSLPRWLARAFAVVVEGVWRLFALKSEPPVTRTTVRLAGETVTVVDAKARRELGYRPIVTREQGLAAMRR
jgi:nucleoside-diphosphate-sugar epimerase